MKCETLNGALTFVLGMLVILGVIFAVRFALLTHEIRTLQKQATICQQVLLQTQQVYNDAALYNQKYNDPRLSQILSIVVKPKTATR